MPSSIFHQARLRAAPLNAGAFSPGRSVKLLTFRAVDSAWGSQSPCPFSKHPDLRLPVRHASAQPEKRLPHLRIAGTFHATRPCGRREDA